MTTAGAITIGQLRAVEAEGRELATQLWTGLGNALGRKRLCGRLSS